MSSPEHRSALASTEQFPSSATPGAQPGDNDTSVVPTVGGSSAGSGEFGPTTTTRSQSAGSGYAGAGSGGSQAAAAGIPSALPPGPLPSAQRPAAKAAAARRGPRRARLQLRGINVWSALRFSVVIAIALFCVWMVMIGVLYGVLDGAGAIGKLNDAIAKINPDGPKHVVTAKMVFGGGVIIGAVYIVLFIALSTIGSVIYNLCADLVGGVEVTLSERE